MNGKRKLTVAALTLALGFGMGLLAFVLALKGKLTPDFVQVIAHFTTVATIAAGSFAAANAAEHWAETRPNATTPTTTEDTP